MTPIAQKHLLLPTSDSVRRLPLWPVVEKLLEVPYEEMSVREQRLIEDMQLNGELYWVRKDTFGDGSWSLTSDLGAPEFVISTRFPKNQPFQLAAQAFMNMCQELI